MTESAVDEQEFTPFHAAAVYAQLEIANRQR